MYIKTKFDIDQCVWFNYNGRKKHMKIVSIEIVYKDLLQVKYNVRSMSGTILTLNEESVFATETELEERENKLIR